MFANGKEASCRHRVGEYDAALLRRVAVGRLQAKRAWPRVEPAWRRRISGNQAGPHQPQRAAYRMVLSTAPRFVVLGGAGAIGRIIVRDLFESGHRNQILIADHDEDAATNLAGRYRKRRVSSAHADARNVRDLASLLAGYSVVINCTRHQFNLNVMAAALQAGTHYLDLC